MRASLYLNEMMNNNEIQIKDIATEFIKILPEFEEKYIIKKLKNLKQITKIERYGYDANKLYLMGCNFDGVYSRDTVLDSYNKGNLKFTNYPSKKNNYLLDILKEEIILLVYY